MGRCGPTARSTQAPTNLVSNRATVYLIGPTVLPTLENFRIIYCMDPARTRGLMVGSLLGFSLQTKCMAWASLHGLMDVLTMVNTSMMSKKAVACLLGKMDERTTGSGKMESNMGEASTQ